MKTSNFLFLVLLNTGQLMAQQPKSPEQELTKEQKWLLDKTQKFYQDASINLMTPVVLKNFKALLVSNTFCQLSMSPIATLQLEGKRINEQITLVEWEVTGEGKQTQYVVERRFDNPYGVFDSIGVLKGRNIAYAYQRYRFTDMNDHPGQTFYRIRQLTNTSEVSKQVKVKGYNNTVTVLPNPAFSSNVQIALSKFKTDSNTSLIVLDSKGRIIYTMNSAFLKGNTTLHLQNLQLAKGTYLVKVANRYNTGSTTFVIQ